MRGRSLVSMTALVAWSLSSAYAADMPNLTSLERPPHAQPAYRSKRPLYGVAAFGPKAEKAVWLVLDQSKPDGDQYDVLYIDLNANGDLTEPGERLTLDKDGRFRLPTFVDPATGVKHGEFSLRATGAEPTVMLSIQWRGQTRFGGGYPQDPEDGYLAFATRPAEAPILWVQGDAPFRFQRWYGRDLHIGKADDFKVFLGQPGHGRSAFFAAQVHFLPDKEWVRATLIYRDKQGKEQRAVCELRERC
jgi:hypothetical protein